MTDVELLNKKISDSGLKLKYIADCLGISRSLLWQKLKNIKPFNQYEIDILCKTLNITDLHEKELIFFAKVVDRNVNK